MIIQVEEFFDGGVKGQVHGKESVGWGIQSNNSHN